MNQSKVIKYKEEKGDVGIEEKKIDKEEKGRKKE